MARDTITSSQKPRFGGAFFSVDLGLGRGRPRLEEIEIAALVGLRDVLEVELAETARVARCRRLPGGAAARELVRIDEKLQLSRRHVERDAVAVADEGERAADEGLR